MTIKELMASLNKFPANIEVVMSRDGEGNSFSPLRIVRSGLYVAENPGTGNVYDADEVVGEDANPVVVLWPMN